MSDFPHMWLPLSILAKLADEEGNIHLGQAILMNDGQVELTFMDVPKEVQDEIAATLTKQPGILDRTRAFGIPGVADRGPHHGPPPFIQLLMEAMMQQGRDMEPPDGEEQPSPNSHWCPIHGTWHAGDDPTRVN